jgi:hypothetical protein
MMVKAFGLWTLGNGVIAKFVDVLVKVKTGE